MTGGGASNPIIVTAADRNYFFLLEGLVSSLRDGGVDLPVGVLDLGLDDAARAWLSDHGCRIVAPGWDVDFPGRDRAPGHYRAMTARPFLPKHFPGFDVYLWIDSDVWVQQAAAVETYIALAADGLLPIVPEIDRSYWTLFKPPKLWGQNQKAFAWGYGIRAGYRLGRNPILNSGVFALRADSPVWDIWAREHAVALRRRRWRDRPGPGNMNFFIAEQTALNKVVFGHKVAATFLPSTYNWFCAKGLPAYDRALGKLVEPNAPYAPICLVHLAGAGMKDREWDIAARDGGTVRTRLTYEAVKALAG